MHLSLLDKAIWATGYIANVLLLLVLVIRRHWRQFPVFTVFIGYYIIQAMVLFFVYWLGKSHLYAVGYWISFALDILLQIALIGEIAHLVLRPSGKWINAAYSAFLRWGFIGAVIALGLTLALHPSAPKGFGTWGVRAYLFTSLLFCELFLSLMFAAHRLNLLWKSHVRELAIGLTLWSIVAAFVDTAHVYWGTTHEHAFRALEHIRSFAWIAALLYWTITFWLPESDVQLPAENSEIASDHQSQGQVYKKTFSRTAC